MLDAIEITEAIGRYIEKIVSFNPPTKHTRIKPKQRVAILSEILGQTIGLIAGDHPAFFAAYDKAIKSHADQDPDKKFKFPLAVKIVIEPEALDYKIDSQFSFSLKHTAKTEGYVKADSTHDMFDGENEEE